MDYQELKPWQISQLVHNQVVCDGKFDVTFENHGCQWKYRDCYLSDEVFEFTINEAKARVKNYTTDINFAWPIIVENKIGVMPAIVRSQRDNGVWIASTDWSRLSAFDSRDTNPLRAAMICFLKMKDAENDF